MTVVIMTSNTTDLMNCLIASHIHSYIAEHWASSSYNDSYIQLMNNPKRATGIMEVAMS